MSAGDLSQYIGQDADEVESELQAQGKFDQLGLKRFDFFLVISLGFKINSQRIGKYSTGGLTPDVANDPQYVMVTRNDDVKVTYCKQMGQN